MTDRLVKELIIARLDEMPESHRLSIGSKGSFTKEQLIEEVKQDSEVGRMIVKIHLDFLRSFKKISDEEYGRINLIPEQFHGEWNYTIKPNKKAG